MNEAACGAPRRQNREKLPRGVAERHNPRPHTLPTDRSLFAHTGELVGGRLGASAVRYGALQKKMRQIYLEKPTWNAEGPPCNITAQATFRYFFPEKLFITGFPIGIERGGLLRKKLPRDTSRVPRGTAGVPARPLRSAQCLPSSMSCLEAGGEATRPR